jgi:hypothetical protein
MSERYRSTITSSAKTPVCLTFKKIKIKFRITEAQINQAKDILRKKINIHTSSALPNVNQILKRSCEEPLRKSYLLNGISSSFK